MTHAPMSALPSSPFTLTDRFAPMAAVLLLVVSGLFAAKYGGRFISPLLALGMYLAGVLLISAGLWRIPASWIERPAMWVLVLAVVVLGSVVVWMLVEAHAVRVDRWTAAASFLTKAGQGHYPYTPAPGANVPGPLPMLFMIAAPFHGLGEPGLLTLAAFLGYAFLMHRIYGNGRKRVAATVLLATAAPFVWEIAVRSDVAANAVLAMLYLWGFLHQKPASFKAIFGWGALGGLVLATRSVVAIPLAVLFAFYFLRERRILEGAVWGLAVGATFGGILLSLYLWDSDLFWVHNPLLVQSRYSSRWIAGALLLVALYGGLRCRSLRDVWTVSGLVLFGAVTANFMLLIGSEGFAEAFFGSAFDVSYFNLTLPLLLPAVATLFPDVEHASVPTWALSN